jgi:uncharacterized membrane protein YdbT with pleckstrin-like domain
MSSYVDSVLAAGERIVYRAAITHWKFALYYLFGGLFLLAGAIGFLSAGVSEHMQVAAAGVLLLIGIGLVVTALIQRLTTELVLTDRRIITKRGLIARDTVEMNLSKVESVRVNQGLLGRVLNYGDVTVIGTGASLEPLRGIANPLELRKQLGAITQEGASQKIT